MNKEQSLEVAKECGAAFGYGVFIMPDGKTTREKLITFNVDVLNAFAECVTNERINELEAENEPRQID